MQFTDAEAKVIYQLRSKDHKVSLEEATQLANEVIGFLDGAAVKSGVARRIGSMTALRLGGEPHAALKSDDGSNVEMPDTVIYVFNFADSAGFAIIAADTRVDNPILAYVDEGQLDTVVDNPGLVVFLTGA